MPEAWTLAFLGLAGGGLLGLAARLGGFCTLGVIEDALFARRFGKLGMWLWALGLSILLVGIAASLGFVDRERSAFAVNATSLPAALLGGLIFGYGMALAGTCGFTALARFGSGDLRAFVILIVIGVSAYIMIGGPLAHIRLWITGSEPNPIWIDRIIADRLDWPLVFPALAIGLLLASGALLIREFRTDSAALSWSTAVAIAIAGGWVSTSYLAKHGFDPVLTGSHSYSAPIGQTLLYAMTSTGSQPNFAIGSVFGVTFGAFLGSLFKGRFSWEACDDPRELSRQILGAFLMGAGAVLALGCSIGQGLTGMAVLNWTAPIVLCAIVLGAVAGIKQLVHGFSW